MNITPLHVAEAMILHGGSFVKALGQALTKADGLNAERIKTAFPEYWDQYTSQAESDYREEEKRRHTGPEDYPAPVEREDNQYNRPYQG